MRPGAKRSDPVPEQRRSSPTRGAHAFFSLRPFGSVVPEAAEQAPRVSGATRALSSVEITLDISFDARGHGLVAQFGDKRLAGNAFVQVHVTLRHLNANLIVQGGDMFVGNAFVPEPQTEKFLVQIFG